jgi:hypothetical protein
LEFSFCTGALISWFPVWWILAADERGSSAA